MRNLLNQGTKVYCYIQGKGTGQYDKARYEGEEIFVIFTDIRYVNICVISDLLRSNMLVYDIRYANNFLFIFRLLGSALRFL